MKLSRKKMSGELDLNGTGFYSDFCLSTVSPHTVVEVRLPGFKLVLSEYLWVRRSTNWAKPGRASTVVQDVASENVNSLKYSVYSV